MEGLGLHKATMPYKEWVKGSSQSKYKIFNICQVMTWKNKVDLLVTCLCDFFYRTVKQWRVDGRSLFMQQRFALISSELWWVTVYRPTDKWPPALIGLILTGTGSWGHIRSWRGLCPKISWGYGAARSQRALACVLYESFWISVKWFI